MISPHSPRRPRRTRGFRSAAAGVALLAIACVLGACGMEDEPLPPAGAFVVPGTPAPTETPTEAPTPVPTATPFPSPTVQTLAGTPSATFAPASVGQGEATVVTVSHPGAAFASVRFLGKHYPLLRDGDIFWAVLAAPLTAPLGPTMATVTTRAPGGGTPSTVEAPISVVAVDRPVDYLIASAAVTSVLTPEAGVTEEFLRSYEQFNAFVARPQWDGVMVRPAEGFISTEFGQGRSINGGPVGSFHSGTDIANDYGTPVRAAAPGRVAWAGPMPIRGNTVLIDHGAGVMTGYHHLQEVLVDVDDEVDPDTTIALMGSTGFSTGPHLHWEMTIYGVNVDPMTWTERVFAPER
ncbi:MAG: peptidoglycan DD-metalloendopeptidase family protein [Dehalococcoidia bacterium]